MKRTITTLALAGALLVLAASPALATHPEPPPCQRPGSTEHRGLPPGRE